MHSKLFSYESRRQIEQRIKDFINVQADLLSMGVATSPRTVGDRVQEFLAEHFQKLLGDWCKTYASGFARRAMADLAFTDPDDFYCVVDVKTHRKEIGFHMPNLISVERLSRFYEDDKNYFVVLLISYSLEGARLVAEEVQFVPIEFLAWDCLTIGALGWGQIQIANSDRVIIAEGNSRRDWMIEFCNKLLAFYPKEIIKIAKRTDHFQKIKSAWVNK